MEDEYRAIQAQVCDWSEEVICTLFAFILQFRGATTEAEQLKAWADLADFLEKVRWKARCVAGY